MIVILKAFWITRFWKSIICEIVTNMPFQAYKYLKAFINKITRSLPLDLISTCSPLFSLNHKCIPPDRNIKYQAPNKLEKALCRATNKISAAITQNATLERQSPLSHVRHLGKKPFRRSRCRLYRRWDSRLGCSHSLTLVVSKHHQEMMSRFTRSWTENVTLGPSSQ